MTKTSTAPADLSPGATKAAAEAPPPVGHNNPPPYDPEKLAEHAKAVSEWADIAGAWKDREKIEDDEQAAKVNDLITEARKLAAEIEAERKKVKQPHLDAGAAVDKAYGAPIAALKLTVDALKPMVTAYIEAKAKELEAARKEGARLAQVEADRIAAEKAAALARNDLVAQAAAEIAEKDAAKAMAAAAKPIKASVQSYTGGGRTMAMRETRCAVIKNPRVAFLAVQADQGVLDAMQAALNRIVRAKDYDGAEIPGVEIITKRGAA